MTSYPVTLVAECPNEDVSAEFRAGLLKLAYSLGVQVKQLTAGDRPSLTVLEGGGSGGDQVA